MIWGRREGGDSKGEPPKVTPGNHFLTPALYQKHSGQGIE
jgi:hypothetical protein